ncbi:MAG: hypothetical protein H0V82_01375 [Candidatus Protochlamydia sp.]|nr:hypothetical protein [Candidatus Protochlamydia sp.]
MTLLTAVQNQMSYYYENLPEQIPQSLLTSFATAFVIRSVTRSDPKLGLIAGAVSMSASLIHALAAPIFKYVVVNDSLTWNQEMARGTMAIIGAGYVEKALVGTANPFEYLFVDVAIHALRLYTGSINLHLRNSIPMVIYPIIPSIPSVPA